MIVTPMLLQDSKTCRGNETFNANISYYANNPGEKSNLLTLIQFCVAQIAKFVCTTGISFSNESKRL